MSTSASHSLQDYDTKPTTVKWPIGLECTYCKSKSFWMSFFQQYNHCVFPSVLYHLSIAINNIIISFYLPFQQ